ncbi:MAG: hypothetical protein RJA22_394 [Verrucomicrobiota bacterium]|jgi:hypothetical protein
MIRWFFRHGLLPLFAAVLLLGQGQAATFKLLNGETITGEPASFNATGVAFKLADGNYGSRVAFTNFTQEALKQIAAAAKPREKAYVEAYIEPDEAELEERRKAAEIRVNTNYPSLDRPNPRAGLGTLTGSAITVLALVLIYLGNVYAGYEASVFRNYHPALGIGAAAVAPVIGPVVFLCLPTRLLKSQDEIAAESMAAHQAALAEAEAAAAAEAAANAPSPEELAAQEEARAAAEAAAAEAERNKVEEFKRGSVTFNRRFFETRFAGFAKLVPGEAEQGKILYFQSARGNYAGSRITRIDPTAVVLQIREGNATNDVELPFAEISLVQIRPDHLPLP